MSKEDYLQVNIESGNRLKKVREQKKLTQNEFAAELGVTTSAYKKLESGENGLSTPRLRKLKALDVSSDYLLYGEINSIESIMLEIHNCSMSEKMEILKRLFIEISQSQCDYDELSKEQMSDMIATVFNKEKV